MLLKRIFRALAWSLGLALAGSALADPVHIRDARSGEALDRSMLLERLTAADYVLLGELHDNPLHHEVRGRLILDLAGLRPGLKVVAEHLELGKPVESGSELLARLTAAGFDAKGWRWPLHETLFAPPLEVGVPLLGGNIPRDEARRIVREGSAALRPALAALMQDHPLSPEARKALEESLIQGHCGQMPERLKGPMVLAQEAKDAAMASGLLGAGVPAVLVAGNGHVRKDYGVPRLLPGNARVISVGFLEEGSTEAGEVLTAHYDYLWVLPAAMRNDPCLEMRLSVPVAGSGEK